MQEQHRSRNLFCLSHNRLRSSIVVSTFEYHLRNGRQQRMIREPSQHRRSWRIRTCPS
jgi:hypothetical protein